MILRLILDGVEYTAADFLACLEGVGIKEK